MRSWLRGRLDRFVAVEIKRLLDNSVEFQALQDEIERLQEELQKREEQLKAVEDRQEALGLVEFLYDDDEEPTVQELNIQRQSCSVAGCTQEHYRDGFCLEHYFERSKQGSH